MSLKVWQRPSVNGESDVGLGSHIHRKQGAANLTVYQASGGAPTEMVRSIFLHCYFFRMVIYSAFLAKSRPTIGG